MSSRHPKTGARSPVVLLRSLASPPPPLPLYSGPFLHVLVRPLLLLLFLVVVSGSLSAPVAPPVVVRFVLSGCPLLVVAPPRRWRLPLACRWFSCIVVGRPAVLGSCSSWVPSPWSSLQSAFPGGPPFVVAPVPVGPPVSFLVLPVVVVPFVVAPYPHRSSCVVLSPPWWSWLLFLWVLLVVGPPYWSSFVVAPVLVGPPVSFSVLPVVVVPFVVAPCPRRGSLSSS